MRKNTQKSYGSVSKTFHWIMGLLILVQVPAGYIMSNLPETVSIKWPMYFFHKSFGVLLFLLVVARLLWRSTEVTPTLPSNMPHWQQLGARWNINLLFAMMIIMPLSGLFMSLLSGYPVNFFNLFTIPILLQKSTAGMVSFQIHMIGGYIISASITLHILAALYHHFVRKDDVLRRMIVNVK
jgi:cytochrome b561